MKKDTISGATVALTAPFDVVDLAEQLCDQLSHDQLFQVIQMIDLTVADAGWTEEVAKWYQVEVESMEEGR